MTWKERRLITVLSVILAILSAALLIVLGIRYRQSRDAVQDPAAQAVQAAQAAGSTYASLSVYSGSATLSFSIQEDGTLGNMVLEKVTIVASKRLEMEA